MASYCAAQQSLPIIRRPRFGRKAADEIPMKLIERYIFRRIASATLLTFIALGAMVWLSQALRQFDLVTADGQAMTTFLQVSALLVPVLVTIVLPVSVMIAVIYVFNTLNTDSELVVINATGARQMTVLKPVLVAATIATLAVGSMTLYFSPLSLQIWTSLITSVRSGVIDSFMRDGAFVQLTPKLTFHMRNRDADGTLHGIFVSDDRDDAKAMTYLAEKGAILRNPLGTFLIMGNGTIQQRSKVDGSISMIEFSSYAFDMSSFASNSAAPDLKPLQRSTAYLLHPDPADPYYRDSPGKFAAELHDRISSPIYCFLFAIVPLLFLGQASSTRQSRNASIAAAVVLVLLFRSMPVFLPSETSVIARIVMYVVPIGLTVTSIVLLLAGVQLRPPERLIAFGEHLFGRISGLVGVRAPATAQ